MTSERSSYCAEDAVARRGPDRLIRIEEQPRRPTGSWRASRRDGHHGRSITSLEALAADIDRRVERIEHRCETASWRQPNEGLAAGAHAGTRHGRGRQTMEQLKMWIVAACVRPSRPCTDGLALIGSGGRGNQLPRLGADRVRRGDRSRRVAPHVRRRSAGGRGGHEPSREDEPGGVGHGGRDLRGCDEHRDLGRGGRDAGGADGIRPRGRGAPAGRDRP